MRSNSVQSLEFSPVAPQEFDLNDLTDLESRFAVHGYAEGFEAGQRAGQQHGATLGFERGRELGEELGFIFGCASAIRDLEGRCVREAHDPATGMTRRLRVVQELLCMADRISGAGERGTGEGDARHTAPANVETLSAQANARSNLSLSPVHEYQAQNQPSPALESTVLDVERIRTKWRLLQALCKTDYHVADVNAFSAEAEPPTTEGISVISKGVSDMTF